MKLTDIISKTLRRKRWRVKKYIFVKPKYRRDSRGRFTGGLLRKGYTRKILNKTRPKVTGGTLLAENVAANNSLLNRLRYDCKVTP